FRAFVLTATRHRMTTEYRVQKSAASINQQGERAMAQDDPQSVTLTATSPAASQPQQIVIQQRTPMFGRFGKWLFGALIVAVLIIISLYHSYHSYFSPANMPQEKYFSLEKFATKKIAIIEVSGAIYEGD